MNKKPYMWRGKVEGRGGGDAWGEMRLQAHWQLLHSPSKQCSWPQWPPLALTVHSICWPQLYTHIHSSKSKPTHHGYTQSSRPALFQTLLQITSSRHMLSRGIGWGVRKATWTLCILVRPASVTRHTEETSEAGGQVLRAPLYVSGVVVMGD